ncbi:MAG: hypothetical protein ABIK62_07400 [candidate division WOR-3 bacterium]
MAIIDVPSGTSCSMVAAVKDTDYVVLVTEPTPFGLSDLELAIEVVSQLQFRFGVVINRVGLGDSRVHEFCSAKGIAILAEIPDDRRIAEAYSRGELVVDSLAEYRSVFKGLLTGAQMRLGKEVTNANL